MAKENKVRPAGAGEVVFTDKAFKTRTLVLPNGSAVPVENARISTEDPAVVAYLDKHPEFERRTPKPDPVQASE